MAILGIDPGLSGALSVITCENNLLIYDIPVQEKPYGKGNMIDPIELNNILKKITSIYNIQYANIEAVSAMPGQGVSSTFTFGRSLGIIEGVVSSYNILLNYITPRKWKKFWDLKGKEKDCARLLIREMYPNYADKYFKRKKDCDRADATLIGLYNK